MRNVSQSEAEYSRQRMLSWAASEKTSTGGRLGDWIFGRVQETVAEPVEELVASKTVGALQRNWRVPAEFPLCPDTAAEQPLKEYLFRLVKGAVAVISPWGETKVGDVAMTGGDSAIYLLGEHGEDSIKPWSISKITFEKGMFVHESQGTFFMRDRSGKGPD